MTGSAGLARKLMARPVTRPGGHVGRPRGHQPIGDAGCTTGPSTGRTSPLAFQLAHARKRAPDEADTSRRARSFASPRRMVKRPTSSHPLLLFVTRVTGSDVNSTTDTGLAGGTSDDGGEVAARNRRDVDALAEDVLERRAAARPFRHNAIETEAC